MSDAAYLKESYEKLTKLIRISRLTFADQYRKHGLSGIRQLVDLMERIYGVQDGGQDGETGEELTDPKDVI
jgi:hypothetical protein